MTKVQYVFLIFFLSLSIALNFSNFLIITKLGSDFYKLDSMVQWFFVVTIIPVISLALTQKYFYDQKYRVVFTTGLIMLVANLVYNALCYIRITSGRMEGLTANVANLYILALIIYAISLIFSNTRQRPLLKLAGISALAILLVYVFANTWRLNTINIPTINLLGSIATWCSVALPLVNLLFIANFVGEIQLLKTQTDKINRKRYFEVILGLLAIGTVLFAGITMRSVLKEGRQQLAWRNYYQSRPDALLDMAGKPRIFINSKGDSLRYLLIKPDDFDPHKKYPLVVCLPAGEYSAPAADELFNSYRSKYPAFIFVPYCPKGISWGGLPQYPSIETLLIDAISNLNLPAIDVKRRYITGVSLGGFGTWELICTRPDLFAAAIPVCGGGNPSLASKVKNVPIWAFHGEKDQNVPVSGSRKMIAAIQQAGGHPHYTEYPGRAHNIWDQVSETLGLWDWLFAQRQP